MSFIFPALLGGLLLAGIPVLLHLIMRQKPKHLLFPAFRFLLQRHRTNQRKLRLRHLLLLALRLILIAGICLALARPKIFSERLNLSSERPVAAVLVFDTSYSMEYVSGGRSRLEEAKRRAGELLDQLPDGSRVAILDTAEPGGEWLPSLSLARDRLGALQLRPANGPVTTRLPEAYRLLADLEQGSEGGDPALPRFLYVFSDRTEESWDQSRLKDLQQFRDRLATLVHAVFVDVGVDSPVDVALAALYLPRQVVPTEDKALLRVTVRATGSDCDTEVICRIDGEEAAERKPIKLAAGQSQVVSFERQGLAPGIHQAQITLAASDSLAFNNTLFATFEVRGGRHVLTLVDELHDADFWKLALETSKAFHCDVRQVADVNQMGPTDLSPYQAICLLSVASPSEDLWGKLKSYVDKGGGLAVIPGGEELDKTSYNGKAAQAMLPGTLIKVVKAEAQPGETWKEASYKHPVLAPFREWSANPSVDFRRFPPTADRYWEVTAAKDDAYVIVPYADKKGLPALLERNFDRKTTRGRVLLYTTPLDRRHLDERHPWNDYLQTSFYLVLINKTVGYLAGDAEEASFNFRSGQTATVALPAAPRSSTYNLLGPGLSPTEANITRAENQGELMLPQAVMPGNYRLLADGKPAVGFSVNLPPEESQLARVPPEQIERLFGPGAILPVGHGTSLHDALQGHWSQPVELFPWVMIVVLLALAVENLLANKFYRREPLEADGTDNSPQPVGSALADDNRE